MGRPGSGSLSCVNRTLVCQQLLRLFTCLLYFFTEPNDLFTGTRNLSESSVQCRLDLKSALRPCWWSASRIVTHMFCILKLQQMQLVAQLIGGRDYGLGLERSCGTGQHVVHNLL